MLIEYKTKDSMEHIDGFGYKDRWGVLVIKDYCSFTENLDKDAINDIDKILKEKIEDHIIFLADSINKEREKIKRSEAYRLELNMWSELSKLTDGKEED